MRTTFDNTMTAHIWAQQSQSTGKSSNGNLHFADSVLYSYRTPIGRFIQTTDGRRAVLVTSNTYSATTSGKHMPALHRAIDYGHGNFAPAFTVPYLEGASGLFYGADIGAKEHAANLAHLVAQYEKAIGQAKRQRDNPRAGLIDTLESKADTARDYAAAFGLAAPLLAPQFDADAILAYRAEREAKASTPAALAKREKAKEAREALAQRKEALARLEGVALVEAWRNGENVPTYRLSPSIGVLLRIKGDTLETSQGATVPLDHAIRVFRAVKRCRDAGTTWQRNGETIRVGHFQVDSIAADGSFRAGCHLINWPEVERAAIVANVA